MNPQAPNPSSPSAIAVVRTALAAARRKHWAVTLFYAANLFLAAVIASPMHAAIADHLGNSATAHELVRGFSASWLTEFTYTYSTFLRGFSVTIAYAGIAFLALSTVLSAGAFEAFAQGEGAGLHAFGRGIGKYFGRFARLAVIASLLYFLVFWIFNFPLERGLDRLFRDSAVERWHFWLNLLRAALLVFCIAVINAIIDYARAALVLRQYPSSLAALGEAAGFVVANFARVLAIYFSIATLTTFTIVIYIAFSAMFPQSGVVTILIWFLIVQALFWLRTYFRLAAWAAATTFFAEASPAIDTIVPEPAPTSA